ncbi:hypothetical protein [Floccifex sp.]|uniref:hypothetical protein n=1 Tax=Floccifex sp. TaxID=2815810 RepID=UPI002A7619BC|nr:hypothetical protein [Floccifex sp.]MDY2957650.1 hypothetical protein [Floccifex sp.]
MNLKSIFKKTSLVPMDLNEKNVVSIYNKCLPTSTTTSFEPSNLMANSETVLQFDRIQLHKQKKTIQFMMGQLRDVHKHKYLVFDHSILKYDGTSWTDSKQVEMYFLNLCRACDLTEPFDVGKRGLMSYYHEDIIPTLSPSDKKYKQWYSKTFG